MKSFNKKKFNEREKLCEKVVQSIIYLRIEVKIAIKICSSLIDFLLFKSEILREKFLFFYILWFACCRVKLKCHKVFSTDCSL